jgi:putative PEP-CTERM system histidine kinase
VLKTLRQAVKAETGSLWINNGAELRKIAGELELTNAPDSLSINEPFIRTMLKESWIFVPQSRETSLAENNRLLPSWMFENTNVWLIVPLIIQMKLVGFALLSRPKVNSDITYEDRDLMTNISTQVASHLLLHQQEKVISDSKQMETYNRLSAFIMHDINNVIAQLALIGKNAERHKKNPAFVDDMIKTVENATSRMQGLVQKFNPASKEKRSEFPVRNLLENLLVEVQDYQPTPELIIENEFNVEADLQKLTLALKNLVRNAQEATQDGGSLTIEAKQTDKGPQIVIQDSGHGMTQRFIDEELFRPFATTKEDNGVGIGAYLTKSYIEHLGALLNVTSQEGSGSRFEITFGH